MPTVAGPRSQPNLRRLTRPDDVRAALESPALIVPPVPAVAIPAPTAAWLRATVARFSSGADHDRRRAATVAELAGVDPARLRRRAGVRTAAILAPGGHPADLVGPISCTVPVAVLAGVLGCADSAGPEIGTSGERAGESGVTRAVADVAEAYLPRPDITVAEEARADRAVAALVRLFGGVLDEATAMRISLLVQTRNATAALVERAAPDVRGAAGAGPVEAAIDAVLRSDPPARSTRRMTATGAIVEVELAGPELAFGAGRHACPGRAQAIALAAGILEALRAADRRRPPGAPTAGAPAARPADRP